MAIEFAVRSMKRDRVGVIMGKLRRGDVGEITVDELKTLVGIMPDEEEVSQVS